VIRIGWKKYLALSSTCLLAALLATPLSLRAQQTAGSITGIVTDQSGAAISGATVTATNVGQGTTWRTRTDGAGLYTLSAVSVGNIQLKVEAPGFTTLVRSSFSLQVNQVARVDFEMKVGRQSQTVTVSGIAPILQTSTSDLGTVLNSRTVNDLPLASRDILQLTLLTPGVVSPNIYAFQSPVSAFGTGRPFVDGAREQDDTFWLDGMDMNQPDNSDVSYTPAPDAVDEYQIITTNAPADYGNYIGGVIINTIKSGTNEYHGDLYEYVRNTDLNANSWQDKGYAYFVNPNTGNFESALPRPPLHWNNFGGTIGGPIFRNKLFFFADEESTQYSVPKTAQSNNLVPTAFLAGNFAAVCTATAGDSFNAQGICVDSAGTPDPAGQLYDPYSGPIGSRTPIPNNNLTSYVATATDGIAMSSVAQKIITSSLFLNSVQQPTYYTSNSIDAYQGDLKIDWQPTQSDHVWGRWTQMHVLYTGSNGIDNALSPAAGREFPLKNFVLNYDHTFTPTLLNEFRVGFQDFPANDQQFANTSGQNLPSVYGLPGVNDTLLPSISDGFQPIGTADLLESFHDTNLEFEDSATWTHGRHTIHGGFEFFNYRMNDIYPGNGGLAGSWSFSGQFTGNTGTSNGEAFADFLLGLPVNVQEGSPFTLHLRNSIYGGYFQDNYQASRNVTFNIGLRYEDITPRNDINKDANINFNLVTGTPEIGANYSNYLGAENFQPRFGFAWKPDFVPQTVVRGGYGVSTYMEGVGVNNMADMNPPNTVAHEVQYGAVNLPNFTLDQGYKSFPASGCTLAGLQTLSAGCISGATIHETNPNLRPAVDQQWNLTIQHQFGNSVTASIGYVGNSIGHMTDIYWYGQSLLEPNGTVAPPPYSHSLFAAGAGAVRYNSSDAVSNYNALEAVLQTRAWHGLDFQSSYTWSKCMTDALGYFGAYGDEEGIGESQTVGQHNFFQNEYNPMGDYGKCITDVASVFNAYGVYSLPFGRGKMFASGVSKPVDEIIGGWQTALDLTMHSGFAIEPAGPDNSGTTSVNPRPDCVAGVPTYMHPQWEQIGGSFGLVTLNSNIASAPAAGTFGNCQNGVWRGPGLETADLNLAKQFSITERTNLELQAQFVNLTNSPIFSLPAAWPGTFSDCVACNGVRTTGVNGGLSNTVGTFGMEDGSNPGRQIELSLKFNY
jgi:hypothetical protein